MAENRSQPPFGMSAALPAFARATRLAKTLFEAFDSSIVLLGPNGPWRSRDNGSLPTNDPAAEIMMASGQPMWVEDALDDPRFADNKAVIGPVGIRFYAGCPVRLSDGAIPGIICVIAREPRPYDAALASRLSDLAAMVADECDRARNAETMAKDQAELETTRLILAAFAETTPASVVMTDREMRVLKASPSWLANFKLTEIEATGRTIYDLGPDVYPPIKAALERCLAGEEIRQDRFKRKRDDQIRWLQTAVTPWRDAIGQIGGIMITANDVTDIVEAKDRTERSEQRLTLALEMADLHVYDIDFVRGTLEKAGAEDTFFERPQTFEDLKRGTNNIVDPRDRERTAREFQEAMASGGLYRTEYRVKRADGQEIWAASAAQLTRDGKGNVIRAVGAMQNITERKRQELALTQAKEAAEAANLAKSTFLATMSHEIRTPLNGVLGMAQAMAVDELCPTQRERLDVIRKSGESLLAILNDVLDLSKIEAGKLELEETDFDIGDLARGAHASFSAVASKKGLTFDLQVERPARGAYRGDSTRVRQILYNLVSNALKFTDAGEVRVVVSRKDDRLILAVSDSGIGIPADRLESLFQKFEQAEVSTNRRFGGTGLGLSICRELTGLMGGEISAQSEPGRGATFTVSLPLPRAIRAAPAPAAAPEMQTTTADRPLRVLAAEDNAVNQLVLRTLLQQIGLEPVIVENGAHAVVAWEREPWDLILMDVQMPEVDGPTATRIIRERELTLGRARTPIIALTANAMAHQVAEYRACGMDGFVAKPIEIARLFAAMQEVLAAPPEAQQAVA